MARIEIWKRGEVEGNRREAPDEWLEEEKGSQVKEGRKAFQRVSGSRDKSPAEWGTMTI